MKNVTFEELKSLPDGTLFTYDSSDEMVAHAVFEKGTDPIKTSYLFTVYEKDDLRKMLEKTEFALGLLPHRAEYEP